MDLVATSHLRFCSDPPLLAAPTLNTCFYKRRLFRHARSFSFPFFSQPIRLNLIVSARKRSSEPEPVLDQSIIEEITMDEADDFEDGEIIEDDDFFEDEYFEENAETYVGDGAEGGGISLAGTWWDTKALELAEEVSLSFDGDLGIYAFKTLANSRICVRIEKLSKKYGSPGMTDIEAFTSAYSARLNEAEVAGSIPDNISLEVSSPGVERVVQIPQDLDRFKDRPMHVKYVNEIAETGSASEHDGVFRLVSFNLETNCCTWGLADVRVNREKSGKGRPLSKKQREWRLDTPFNSLHLVRLYSEM